MKWSYTSPSVSDTAHPSSRALVSRASAVCLASSETIRSGLIALGDAERTSSRFSPVALLQNT